MQEFLISLSNFAGGTKDDKLRFALMVFDEDGNGVITQQVRELWTTSDLVLQVCKCVSPLLGIWLNDDVPIAGADENIESKSHGSNGCRGGAKGRHYHEPGNPVHCHSSHPSYKLTTVSFSCP